MTGTPPFPGGTAVTDLRVYDEATIDGCHGGTPHLHTTSSEGYVVVGGSGAVHTVSREGIAERSLTVGDVVWFTPGTVHRLVNDGDLRLIVVMSNAGLPEAGDAVMTFPAEVLDDPEAYAAASALPAADPGGPRDSGDADARAHAVRVRRDLAMCGYLELRTAVEAGDDTALAALHARAARLVQPKVAAWRALWERTVAVETARTRAQLDALSAGEVGALGSASVRRAVPTGADLGYGMCGRLRTWHWT